MRDRLKQRYATAFIEKYPVEAGACLDYLSPEDLKLLLDSSKPAVGACILSFANPERLGKVLDQLEGQSLNNAVGELDSARMAVFFHSLDPERKERVLNKLPAPIREEVKTITSYPPGTAGSLMDSKVLTISRMDKVSSVLSRLRKLKGRQIFEVFVVDEARRLLGKASVQELAVSPQNDLVKDHMQPVEISVGAISPKDEVAEAFEHYKVTTLPVTHVGGELLGVIRHQALVSSVQDQASADLVAMVGGSREERALSSSMTAVKNRLPWLLINLLTAFLASAVVGVFENTIAQVSALAVLLPVVAGQSGNTGAQAMAVTMRGLALREIRIRHWPKLVLKECGAGFFNGLAVALVTSIAVFFWSGQAALGAVIGVAMVMSMILASMSGAAVPIVLTALGRDPAQSSSIVLTTVTDVMGFLSFLGLATLFVSFLVSP